jgi:hypothetical protein
MWVEPYFEFVTNWSVEGTLATVNSILRDVESFPRWWRPVYVLAQVIEAGEPDGVGRRVQFTTRGFLPYVLHWELRVVQSHEPYGFGFTARGDLTGTGSWKLWQDHDRVRLQLEWNVRAEKTTVRAIARVSRTLVATNHSWAMAKGQEGLAAEILRRSACP